jgi:hypothetical protein
MVELSETFYLTLMATGAGILGLVIKKLSASKCDEVSFWGIHIHRRVEMETSDVESKGDDNNSGVRPSMV